MAMPHRTSLYRKEAVLAKRCLQASASISSVFHRRFGLFFVPETQSLLLDPL
jgi:hypothetical protein